jgi:hypothetical protein
MRRSVALQIGIVVAFLILALVATQVILEAFTGAIPTRL